MSIFSIIHEIPVGARFPISQDQISRIQEEALALEARIAELEAENARFVNCVAARMLDIGIAEVTEAMAQQVREFVNSEKYLRVFGKKEKNAKLPDLHRLD